MITKKQTVVKKQRIVEYEESVLINVETGPGYVPVYRYSGEAVWRDNRRVTDHGVLANEPSAFSNYLNSSLHGSHIDLALIYVPAGVEVQAMIDALNTLKTIKAVTS